MKKYYLTSLILFLILSIIPSSARAADPYTIVVTANANQKTATITVNSTLPVETKGKIATAKAGQGPYLCGDDTNPVVFAVGGNFNCQVTNLDYTTYTITVTGKDVNGKSYSATKTFTLSPNPGGSGQGGASTTTTTVPNPNGSGQGGASTTSGGTYTPTANPNGQASGFSLQVRLNNPLKVNTIKDAVQFFVNTLIKIAIPFIVIFFMWSGLKFILARGKPEEIKNAKKMFWYTIIGTLLILGAWTITNAIIGTVNSITK